MPRRSSHLTESTRHVLQRREVSFLVSIPSPLSIIEYFNYYTFLPERILINLQEMLLKRLLYLDWVLIWFYRFSSGFRVLEISQFSHL